MNSENNGHEINNDVSPAHKPSKPKTLIGVVVLILLLVFIGWRYLGLFFKHTQNTFAVSLRRYYTLVSQGSTNDISKMVTGDFVDKQSVTNRIGRRFTLYLFKIENVSLTNGINASTKVVFCLIDNNKAYLNDAYFLTEGHKQLLSYIDNRMTGTKIIVR